MEPGKGLAVLAVLGVVFGMFLLATMSGLVALASAVLRRFYHRVVWRPPKHRQ